MADKFPDWAFQGANDSPDTVFNSEPRRLIHLDEPSLNSITQLYGELLPDGGAILDLLSSSKSHLPNDIKHRKVCGLGMNAKGMSAHDLLEEFVVHNVDSYKRRPLTDGRFDAAIMTISGQYLTCPVELFPEVGQTLKSKRAFIVRCSRRNFPTRTVYIWQVPDLARRHSFIEAYFRDASYFVDRNPDESQDPVHSIWALRSVATTNSLNSFGEP